MGEKRRQWFPQRLAGRWWRRFAIRLFGAELVGLALMRVLVLIGLRTGWHSVLFGILVALLGILILVVVLAAPILATWPRQFWERRGIEVHDDGLSIVGWLGARVHVPWSAVCEVRRQDDSATFTSDGQRVVLDDWTKDWRRLYREIERGTQPDAEAADSPDDVTAEEVAECLGIAADGVLEFRPGRYAKLVAALSLALFCAVEALLLHTAGVSPLLAVGLFGVLSVAIALMPAPTVRADASGLALKGGRKDLCVPWSAVFDIEVWPGRVVVVETDDGQIPFGRSIAGGAQLEAGIRKLLSARRAGRALPSAAPPSDAALSQARLKGDADSQRGLSQVGEEDHGS